MTKKNLCAQSGHGPWCNHSLAMSIWILLTDWRSPEHAIMGFMLWILIGFPVLLVLLAILVP